MFGTKQQTWTVVDLGARWIKCARYQIQRSLIRECSSQVIDIQAEGLLSAEEIAAAVGRVLRPEEEHPLAVVLPQGTAISQVMDLPGRAAGAGQEKFEAEILELIGSRAERCVYDSHPLKSFGGYASPQWISVAKEKDLNRQLAPLLGQSLRIEAVTTGGNALVAAFRHLHPEVADACLVDIGATQTTLIRLQNGEPIQMTSLAGGGERWTEALSEVSREAFEDAEVRLFDQDLFADPVGGPVLQSEVSTWRDRLLRQIEEWHSEFGMPESVNADSLKIYLFGGYTAVQGLGRTLTAGGGASWQVPPAVSGSVAPLWTHAYGAVLMAAGISGLKSSILPQALVKMRQRRRNVARLQACVFYLFLAGVMLLTAAVFKQQGRLDALGAATGQADATLEEIRDASQLLERRDQLAARIEPIVRAQLKSLNTLETFRRIQLVQQELDFGLIRFVDRQTYFQGIESGSGPEELSSGNRSPGKEPGIDPQDQAASTQAFVVQLAVRGDQAEQLQALGDIAGRLRQENYFANVDRLVGGPEAAAAENGLLRADEGYVLLLTLAGQAAPAPAKKGAGQ